MQEDGLEIIGASCFIMFERVYCLSNEFIINPGKIQKGDRGGRGSRGRGTLGGVVREVFVNQSLQGCSNCSGGRAIRKCEVAYGVGVDFMLDNFRE